jgi:hypothetical protein
MSGLISVIARAKRRAYGRRVSVVRLMRFLTILSVLMSPIAMVAGTPAQAMPHHGVAMAADAAAMPPGHCAGINKQSKPSKDQPGHSTDCMMACAAMLPALGSEFEMQALAPAPVERPALTRFAHGLEPEAATPPPRFA